MEKCWKLSTVNKCTKRKKEKKKERKKGSGFGFALVPWERAQTRTLFWVSYISQFSRPWSARFKRNSEIQIDGGRPKRIANFYAKFQVPGTWNKNVLLFRVGPFALFWPFFLLFGFLGGIKKVKEKLWVSLYPCQKHRSFLLLLLSKSLSNIRQKL